MKRWKGLAAALGMLVLILDGQTALAGAQQGIDLCLKTVIPSLFPFFLLSNLLTNTLTGMPISLLKPLGKLCKIPAGAESILISGFLGGYPVGAQSITSAYTSGNLTKSAASRMLAFCNNAGPAFLFGMVAAAFPSKGYVCALWAIHILSAIFVAMTLPGTHEDAVKPRTVQELTIAAALRNSLATMATVCGWVTLFRVLVAFLNRWVLWLLPQEASVLLIGLLELSNGCWELFSVADIPVRFMLCSAMLAFGGLCVTMQTVCVCGGLSMKFYLYGKLLQTFFSILLSWGYLQRTWLSCFAILTLSLFLFGKIQKSSSNPRLVGV